MYRRLTAGLLGLLTLTAVVATGCVQQAAPPPATISDAPPPWPAPKDAISWIDAAGLPQQRLDVADHQRTFEMTIGIDGQPVPLAPWIGIDRLRAVQAPVHTHDDSGTVWLEGSGTEQVTLDQFFRVWGVRFDGRCLGAACGKLRVRADGRTVADPGALRLVTVSRRVDVTLRTS